jgi:serine/threonine-protein kinase
MPQPVHTVADFLAVVRKSGLVDADRLAAATAAWPDTDAPLPDELPQALVTAGLLTDWQVGQLRKGRHKGFMLGKYRLLQLLGAGGMSSVYLAENTTLHQRVAIKVLPLKRVQQSSFLGRFRREAQMAFRLSHQNVARAFDLDHVGEIHFIVMEYVDGTDLHAKVKREGPLPVREAVEYLRQAALGLHHAHEEGLVHRDVKPSNLMLDRKGTIKVLDLGLAMGDEDEAASLTREHDEKVLGTADYLAPEQATDSHTVDRRSDIYSLGCTLHYLLVGKAPFAQGKLAERVQAHLKKPPPNLVEERADVPLPIAQLYFRMMEKHPDARPLTAQEVAEACAAWLSANPAGSSAGGTAAPPRRGPPRRPSAGSGPMPVMRSGPGSSSTSSVSLGLPRRPTGGASNPRPAAGPKPPSGAVPSKPLPPGAKPGGVAGRTAAGITAAAPAAAAADSTTTAPAQPPKHRRKPIEFAGLPLGYWITLAVGLITVSVLGSLLWLRNR